MTRLVHLTAATIHHKGDIPAVIKFCKGPYTCEHWNREKVLKYLKNKIKPKTHQDLTRVFYYGCPAYCKAHSTERNWKEYMNYTNHKTVHFELKKTVKILIKDRS